MITLDGVSFSYKGHTVLDGISLSLQPGEIACVLGESGCGKTTLLQLCAGLQTQQKGRIDAAIVRPGATIGYMQQDGGLLPWRRAWENVVLGCQLLGKSANRVKAEALLELVGLSGKADAFPSELSGGQQQRVALARQLIMEPKFLLFDEPLAALDIVLRQDLAKLIKDIVKAQDIMAIVVTHSPDEAIFLADHLYLLAGHPARIRHHWQMQKDLAPETAFHEVTQAMREVKAHSSASDLR